LPVLDTCTYLNSNSLGAMPRRTRELVAQYADKERVRQAIGLGCFTDRMPGYVMEQSMQQAGDQVVISGLAAGDVEPAQLVRHLYGLDVVSVERINDQSFKINAPGGDAFLLKIARVGTKRAQLEYENTLLTHLRLYLPELECGRIVHTKEWQKIGTFCSPGGAERFLRLLTFRCSQTPADSDRGNKNL